MAAKRLVQIYHYRKAKDNTLSFPNVKFVDRTP